jgi:PTS system N-acetylglucosamine-specific IIC component
VAIGFAETSDGSAALAAVVGLLVRSKVLQAFPVPDAIVNTAAGKGLDVTAVSNDPGAAASCRS